MRKFNQPSDQPAPPPYNPGSVAPQQQGQTFAANGNTNAFPPQQQTNQPVGPAHQPPQSAPIPYPTQTPPPQTQQQPRKLSLFMQKLSANLRQALRAERIDTQIARIAGKDKFLDFSDGLVRADPQNYGNLHGIGGEKHATNSVIRLNLTDYSQGAGNSTYVSVNLDVYQVDELLTAVRMANCGLLGMSAQLGVLKAATTANGILIGWLQSGHCPTFQELANLQQMLGQCFNQRDAGAPEWKMPTVLKANPYRRKDIGGVTYAEVSSLDVSYFQDKNYCWAFRVVNFYAPLNEWQNGSITFNGKNAVERKEVLISVTTSDLLYALNNVDHFIWNWEQQLSKQTALMHEEKENRKEIARAAYNQNN